MGMFCQINLFKPSNVPYKPGEIIVGIIKYAVHEPMEFERITTSLKGSGYLKIRVDAVKRDKTYTADEKYVDVDNVISVPNVLVPVKRYEIKFNFKIPENLPSSLEYNKKMSQYKVKCRIKYYIRIKFKPPGWFSFSKHFRKEITVVSGIVPQLLMEPVIYGESKKLMRLFSRKNATVSIKATIINSVIPSGGKIHVNCEIKNDTNVVIGRVETKLVEMYTFKAPDYSKVIHRDEVPNTNIKTERIDSDVSRSWPLSINAPLDCTTIQNSKIVTRDYVVRVTAEMPMPHRNVVLDIPVQIGMLPSTSIPGHIAEPSTSSALPAYEDPPPSYWEVMGETDKRNVTDNDYSCNEFEKGEKSSTV